jgi:hypothetical protein
MVHTTDDGQREVLLRQGTTILRASCESILERPDFGAVRRRYDLLLAASEFARAERPGDRRIDARPGRSTVSAAS